MKYAMVALHFSTSWWLQWEVDGNEGGLGKCGMRAQLGVCCGSHVKVLVTSTRMMGTVWRERGIL